MADPVVPVTEDEGPRAWLRRHAVLLAAIGPVALMVAVRWWLQWRLDRQDQALPAALSPASDPNAVMLTVVLVTLGCLAFGGLVWWLVRKPGPLSRGVRVGALGLWALVWLAGSAQSVRSHFNAVGVQASRTEVLRLVGLKVSAPSLRSVGGARLYLDWPEQGGLHTVLIESPTEALLRQPARVQLQLAPGRWGGWYAVGWSLVPLVTAPTAPPGSPAWPPLLPTPPEKVAP